MSLKMKKIGIKSLEMRHFLCIFAVKMKHNYHHNKKKLRYEDHTN